MTNSLNTQEEYKKLKGQLLKKFPNCNIQWKNSHVCLMKRDGFVFRGIKATGPTKVQALKNLMAVHGVKQE
jgi:hypothetical protein